MDRHIACHDVAWLRGETDAASDPVANNGKMVKPKFVDELGVHGRIVKIFDSDVIDHSICSKSTLNKAKTLLKGVVENGTARNLNNTDFKIAGKTGTYRSETGVSYQASFVGYFPAEDPKYSCIVVISNPSKSIYHGNEVAGPVFLEIAKKVHSLDFTYAEAGDKENPSLSVIPYSKDGLKSSLSRAAYDLDIPVNSDNAMSDWITTSKKESGIEIEDKKLIPNLVPDVVMMGARDAAYLLENAGLKVRIKGRGSVRSQSIAPGARVNKGGVIELEMSFI